MYLFKKRWPEQTVKLVESFVSEYKQFNNCTQKNWSEVDKKQIVGIPQ